MRAKIWSKQGSAYFTTPGDCSFQSCVGEGRVSKRMSERLELNIEEAGQSSSVRYYTSRHCVGNSLGRWLDTVESLPASSLLIPLSRDQSMNLQTTVLAPKYATSMPARAPSPQRAKTTTQTRNSRPRKRQESSASFRREVARGGGTGPTNPKRCYCDPKMPGHAPARVEGPHWNQRKPPIMMTPARPIAPEMDDLPKAKKPGKLPYVLTYCTVACSYPDEP